MLTNADVAAALSDLAAIFPRARNQTPNVRVVDLYRETLGSHTLTALEGGVRIWCKTGERFPSPKQLNDACWDYVKANRIEVEAKRETFDANPYSCRVCQSTPRLAILSCPTEAAPNRELARYVIGCDPTKHTGHERQIPLPPNFVEWAEPHTPAAVLAAAPLEQTRRAERAARQLAESMVP